MTRVAAPLRETAFPAMGSSVRIVTADGHPGIHEEGRRMIARLESAWSRFIPSSEISLLNSRRTARVSQETIALVTHMVEAWRATGGRFDPTVGRAMSAIGYDASFETGLDASGRMISLPAEGCDDIEVDPVSGTVSLPGDVVLDPGGIGKGLAADLVARHLRQHVSGVLVNVGGDLKVLGDGPHEGGWVVDIVEEAVRPGTIGTVLLPGDAALATSTPLRRTWTKGSERAHHLVDPLTGLPHQRVAALVSVVAADAWWAEAVTKQIVGVDPEDAGDLLQDASALMVSDDGETHLLGGMQEFLA